jgi:ubiquinol-cytochrome c reductase cytochrome c subunit
VLVRGARRAVLLAGAAATALALAAAPAAVRAQPPAGIARPDDERGLSSMELGSELFAGNCAVCHGTRGAGIRTPRPNAGGIEGQGPSLRGVGAAAADFYLRTGYMPLEHPDEQPSRRRPPFTDREIRALVAYVASLGGGPPIPSPDPAAGNESEGLHLFTDHCAGCHQVVAKGGIVTGAKVPPLEHATATQIAEAVRTGPYLMPRFPRSQISDAELDSIIAYVERSKHPVDRGGWGLGNIGPVPEGMVTWLIAALLLVAVCMAIGQRART